MLTYKLVIFCNPKSVETLAILSIKNNVYKSYEIIRFSLIRKFGFIGKDFSLIPNIYYL